MGGGGGGNEGIEVTGIRGGTGPLRFMAAARAAAAAAAAADEGSAVDVVGATAAAGGCSGASAGFSGVDLGLPTLSTSETECDKDVSPLRLTSASKEKENETTLRMYDM